MPDRVSQIDNVPFASGPGPGEAQGAGLRTAVVRAVVAETPAGVLHEVTLLGQPHELSWPRPLAVGTLVTVVLPESAGGELELRAISLPPAEVPAESPLPRSELPLDSAERQLAATFRRLGVVPEAQELAVAARSLPSPGETDEAARVAVARLVTRAAPLTPALVRGGTLVESLGRVPDPGPAVMELLSHLETALAPRRLDEIASSLRVGAGVAAAGSTVATGAELLPRPLLLRPELLISAVETLVQRVLAADRVLVELTRLLESVPREPAPSSQRAGVVELPGPEFEAGLRRLLEGERLQGVRQLLEGLSPRAHEQAVRSLAELRDDRIRRHPQLEAWRPELREVVRRAEAVLYQQVIDTAVAADDDVRWGVVADAGHRVPFRLRIRQGKTRGAEAGPVGFEIALESSTGGSLRAAGQLDGDRDLQVDVAAARDETARRLRTELPVLEAALEARGYRTRTRVVVHPDSPSGLSAAATLPEHEGELDVLG